MTYFAAKHKKVDVRRTEEYLSRLETLFGPLPEGWHMEYYRYPSIAQLEDSTGLHAYGVTDLARSRVHSVRDFHPHELVHAATQHLGRPPVFFVEGLAVA